MKNQHKTDRPCGPCIAILDLMRDGKPRTAQEVGNALYLKLITWQKLNEDVKAKTRRQWANYHLQFLNRQNGRALFFKDSAFYME